MTMHVCVMLIMSYGFNHVAKLVTFSFFTKKMSKYYKKRWYLRHT